MYSWEPLSKCHHDFDVGLFIMHVHQPNEIYCCLCICTWINVCSDIVLCEWNVRFADFFSGKRALIETQDECEDCTTWIGQTLSALILEITCRKHCYNLKCMPSWKYKTHQKYRDTEKECIMSNNIPWLWKSRGLLVHACLYSFRLSVIQSQISSKTSHGK